MRHGLKQGQAAKNLSLFILFIVPNAVCIYTDGNFGFRLYALALAGDMRKRNRSFLANLLQ
jgi:hypothetical protein